MEIWFKMHVDCKGNRIHEEFDESIILNQMVYDQNNDVVNKGLYENYVNKSIDTQIFCYSQLSLQ